MVRRVDFRRAEPGYVTVFCKINPANQNNRGGWGAAMGVVVWVVLSRLPFVPVCHLSGCKRGKPPAMFERYQSECVKRGIIRFRPVSRLHIRVRKSVCLQANSHLVGGYLGWNTGFVLYELALVEFVDSSTTPTNETIGRPR